MTRIVWIMRKVLALPPRFQTAPIVRTQAAEIVRLRYSAAKIRLRTSG